MSREMQVEIKRSENRISRTKTKIGGYSRKEYIKCTHRCHSGKDKFNSFQGEGRKRVFRAVISDPIHTVLGVGAAPCVRSRR
jgi:hypothetical protein